MMLSSEMNDFATRLRKHRQMLNVSQQTLAEACGISWRHQRDYESGLLKPNPTYLYALASAGFDLGYLTSGEPTRQPPMGMDQGMFTVLENFRSSTSETKAQIFLSLMIAAAPSHEQQRQEDARLRCEKSRAAANDEAP